MKCEIKTTQKYRNRPSPPYPANQCPNTVKKGNDGRKYKSKPNKNGVYSWKHVSKQSSRKTSRKSSRKTSRKSSRKSRKTSRKSSRKTSRKSSRKTSRNSKKTSRKSQSGYEMFDWVDMMEDKHLQIKDIMKLKSGDKLKLLFLGHNYSDIATSYHEPEIKYDPKQFFKNNQVIYIHEKGLEGCMQWDWGEDFFRFDVDYMNRWRQLDDNGYFYRKYRHHWKKLPKDTRVGYEGPFMLWKHLDGAPKIYWTE